MKMAQTVSEFVDNLECYREEVLALREILLELDCQETLKWGAPTYTVNGKNVVGIGAFKRYFGLWFFHGSLLEDPKGVLINAQKDRTTAMRQWRFTSAQEMDVEMIRSYVLEAMENMKAGRVVAPKKDKPIILDPVMLQFFEENPEYRAKFESQNKTNRREMAAAIVGAKQQATKEKRMQKVADCLDRGVGLYDKYKG